MNGPMQLGGVMASPRLIGRQSRKKRVQAQKRHGKHKNRWVLFWDFHPKNLWKLPRSHDKQWQKLLGNFPYKAATVSHTSSLQSGGSSQLFCFFRWFMGGFKKNNLNLSQVSHQFAKSSLQTDPWSQLGRFSLLKPPKQRNTHPENLSDTLLQQLLASEKWSLNRCWDWPRSIQFILFPKSWIWNADQWLLFAVVSTSHFNRHVSYWLAWIVITRHKNRCWQL